MSGFPINPLINENCHSLGTSTDIDMKLKRVTKFEKT